MLVYFIFLGIDVRKDDIELPPAYLDFNAMVHHQFVERNESPLQYRVIFDRRRAIRITLPAPAFFDYEAKGRYVITREAADEYERRAPPCRAHPLSRGPLVAPLHLCQHPHTSSSTQKNPHPA